MAESSYNSWTDGYGEHRYKAEIILWWTDDTATSAVLHAKGGGWLYNSDGWGGSSIDLAGVKSETGGCDGGPTNYYWGKSNWYWDDVTVGTYTKSYSSQSISKSCSFNYGAHGTVTATTSITLGAKWSYSVTYNANGGSGAPAGQTKWYGDTLTLQNGTPTKSGFAFKGWSGSDGNTYQAGSNYTGNSALTLTAIWQALTTDLDDVDDTEIGDNPEFSWTPQASELTYILKLSLGEWSWESDAIAPASTSKYTYNSKTIPMEVCNQLPDQTEGIMQVDLETYNGETKTGTSTKYFTVFVPDSLVPVITQYAIGHESNGLNKFLQNYSTAIFAGVVGGNYGSTLVSAEYTVEGKTYTTVPTTSALRMESDILEEAGYTDVSLKVTDSRGRTKTVSGQIHVYEYYRPWMEILVEKGVEDFLNVTMTPHFASVDGANSASFTYDGVTYPAEDGFPKYETVYAEHINSRNQEITATLTDAVTFSINVGMLYWNRANRFETLDDDQFYIGMDSEGWEMTESDYDGGIKNDGTVWFERTSGESDVGIGIPMILEADNEYELIYSSNIFDDDTVSKVIFFNEETDDEDGFVYLSTTNNLKSGEIFRVPKLAQGVTSLAVWGIILLGVSPSDYEETPIGYREFKDIIVRKVNREVEPLEWEVETGNLGLDNPYQKYISKFVIRIAFTGEFYIKVAYDNGSFTEVFRKSTEALRSFDIPINVRRCDHFRFKIGGTGTAKIYSISYSMETGSEIC